MNIKKYLREQADKYAETLLTENDKTYIKELIRQEESEKTKKTEIREEKEKKD